MQENYIAQQSTNIFSSQQNDIAECYWLTFFDNARAPLLSSKLLESLWVKAFDTDAYTRNSLIASAINDAKTP